MERKHAALADFFSGILGIDKDKAQETACKLEHTVDSGLSGKLAEFAEFVRENASGKTAGLIADFREFSAARAQTGIRE
jgi:Mn-dependent DtxR family transcriptional regulator